MNSKFKHLSTLIVIAIIALIFLSVAYAGVTDVTNKNRVTVKTTVRKNYTDSNINGIIDLTDGKNYTVDFTKTDDFSKGLQLLADLNKTKLYKIDENNGFVETSNESDAIIKVEGKKDENKAVFSSLYKEDIKSYTLIKTETVYTGSKLTYTGTTYEDGNILIGEPNEVLNSSSGNKVTINEIRDDYFTNYNFNLTFKYGNSKITPTEYKFIEGSNQTYTINQSKELTFRIDAEYNKFNNKIYVDNQLIDIKNFESKSGSTIITFKNDFANTLTIGEHLLKVEFNDGSATTKFKVDKLEETPKNNEKENNNSNMDTNKENTLKTENKISNPKTGDNIVIYIVIFAVAFISIVALMIIKKTKKTSNK